MSDWQSFKCVRNICTQHIRQAKASYFKYYLAGNGPDYQRFWNIIKTIEKETVSLHLSILNKHDGVVLTDKPKMVKQLNRHFVNAGSLQEQLSC